MRDLRGEKSVYNFVIELKKKNRVDFLTAMIGYKYYRQN